MRAAGGEQVAEDRELVVLGELGRLGLDREGALRRLLGTRVAAAEVLRERVAKRGLAGAIAPRGAPLARPSRQADQRVDRLDDRDEQEARPDEQQHEQVERQVEPPRARVEADEAIVGAEGRRRDDRDREQQHEPDREAHSDQLGRAPRPKPGRAFVGGKARSDRGNIIARPRPRQRRCRPGEPAPTGATAVRPA